MKLLLTDVMILIMKLNIYMNMNPTLKTLPQGKDGNTQCQNERNKKNIERNLFANQSSQILMKELKNNNLKIYFSSRKTIK